MAKILLIKDRMNKKETNQRFNCMINLSAMDMGLSIGFFAIFALFGTLDYATIFTTAPFMNENAITIISLLIFTGAMAKSAQLGLHSWLPGLLIGSLNDILNLRKLS